MARYYPTSACAYTSCWPYFWRSLFTDAGQDLQHPDGGNVLDIEAAAGALRAEFEATLGEDVSGHSDAFSATMRLLQAGATCAEVLEQHRQRWEATKAARAQAVAAALAPQRILQDPVVDEAIKKAVPEHNSEPSRKSFVEASSGRPPKVSSTPRQRSKFWEEGKYMNANFLSNVKAMIALK